MPIVGHGIDLVEVARIRAMLYEHGQRFLDRCFTPAEQAYKADSRRRIEHLAARFAAKEAVLKALGTGLTGGIAWTDIEVISTASGAPKLALRGSAQTAAASLGITSWVVSLTHTDSLAMASVIALGSPASH
jgi:holo-[acyl-carrier protein] synthase